MAIRPKVSTAKKVMIHINRKVSVRPISLAKEKILIRPKNKKKLHRLDIED